MLRLFVFLWKLVDDFIAAHKAEIFAGDAFKVAAIRFEGYDFTLQFFIIGPVVRQPLFDFIFILFKFKNAQQPFITKNSEEQDECQASSWNDVHLFLKVQIEHLPLLDPFSKISHSGFEAGIQCNLWRPGQFFTSQGDVWLTLFRVILWQRLEDDL